MMITINIYYFLHEYPLSVSYPSMFMAINIPIHSNKWNCQPHGQCLGRLQSDQSQFWLQSFNLNPCPLNDAIDPQMVQSNSPIVFVYIHISYIYIYL